MDVRRGLVPLLTLGKPHGLLPGFPAICGAHDAEVALVADDVDRVARRERPRMNQRHVAPVLPGLAPIIARVDFAVPQASVRIRLDTRQFLYAVAALIHGGHEPSGRQQREAGAVGPDPCGIGRGIDRGFRRGNGDGRGFPRGSGAGRRGGEEAACGNGLDEGSAFHGDSCGD